MVVAGCDVGALRDGRRRSGRDPTTSRRMRSSSATRPAASAGSASAATGSTTRRPTRRRRPRAPPSTELRCPPAAGATPTSRRRRRCATSVRPAPGSAGMIPIARPDIGPRRSPRSPRCSRAGCSPAASGSPSSRSASPRSSATKHAIAVSNGTVALMCIFQGLGLGPGDEVITVGHTFNATVSAILSTGATPVFVDIEPDTYNIDAGRIEAAITPRTRAICPVHLFGLPADMDAIVGHRRPPRPGGRRGRLPGARRRVRRPARSAASGTARSACTARRT